jgi:PAS domain S-box-containing protein
LASSFHPPAGAAPGRPLRLLILEDEPSDALAAVACLRHDGLDVEWSRVESEAAFRAALAEGPDLILADYVVPGFGALDALRTLREFEAAPPVIVLTGKLDDTGAVEALRHGAADYLLKDRLARLPQAVRRALREAAGEGLHSGVAAALRKSEERARMDFEQQLVGMFVTTPDGRILDCNAAVARILGFATVDELLRARASSTYSDPAHRDLFVEDVRRHGRLQLVEEELRRADGTPVHILESVLGVFDEDGDLREIRGYMVDITELKRAQSQRDSLAAAMEQAAEAVVITDAAGTMEYLNAAYTNLTGYTRDEALGQNPRILKSGVQGEEFYRRLWAALTSGSTWTGRIVNRRKDGTLFTADATISPIHDSAGTLTGYLSFQRDVTREIALETQLATSQKLEAVGRMAAGVAHDFNNVLTVITAGAQLSLDPATTMEEVRADLQEMLNAARRGAALSHQLLAFGRQHVLQPEILDPNDLVREIGKMLSRVIGEDIDLRLDLDPGVGRVRVDPAQFQTAVMNLAINARDAMPGGGRLTIRTAYASCNDDPLSVPPPGPAGRCILIEVSDTGQGMDAAVRERIFEPFFTTKKEGKGSGLGLAMVYGTVTQSGGSISVESEPGRGATFRIYLPVVQGDQGAQGDAEAVPADTSPAPRHAGGSILLVEDDAPVRRGVQRILESLGYRVEAFGHPDDALRRSLDPGSHFDLLVTDLVMPGMDGVALATDVRQRHPALGVLFVSGYAPKRVFSDGVVPSGTYFLAKPFTREQLGGKILEALGRA